MAAAASTTATTLPRFDVGLPPSRPELHAQQQSLSDVLQPTYWLALSPQLHVGDAAFIAGCKPIKPPKQRLQGLATQINEDGVAQVEPQELPWQLDLGVLADAVVNLVRHGWPPSLLVVYDEVWAMVQQASAVMKEATGNECNMDILAWLVDPNRGDAGFSPHRDRQPDDAPATFRADGSAMYATMWVPLTPATPENSCLYVIPRFADPGYFVGDPEDEDAPDPLTAALSSKEAYQHIRALPAQPGAALLFTHRTIHWGSKGRPGYPTPRISLSWGCADDAYEPPYFSRKHLPCPPLALRLGLAGAQMICYHERFPAPAKQLKLYYAAFTAQAQLFDSTYRAKVVREFVDASKEATAAAAAGGGGQSSAKKAKRPAQQAGVSAEQQQQSPPPPPKQQSKTKQKQQQQQQQQQSQQQEQPQQLAAAKASKKRAPAAADPGPPPAAAAAAAAAAAGSSQSPAGKRASKRRKQQEQQEEQDSTADEDDDDGVGIDFALLAAQARAAAAGGLGAVAAAAAAANAAGAALMLADDDDDDDVMDLALQAMLEEGSEGDFADDYEDEEGEEGQEGDE